MARRKLYRQIYKKSKAIKGLCLLWKISGMCILLFGFVILGLFIYYAKDLPRPEKFTEKQFTQSTKIYDRTGEVLLYKIYGEEKRTHK